MSDKLQAALPETRLMKLPAYVDAAMREISADNQTYQPGQQP
ncbi:MAG: hypothetical protein ABSA23_14935 [Anaerolineales bacterium]|jgi:hypothetical protein